MNLEEKLQVMRDAGWLVAVHNDYRLAGVLMTFWVFTNVQTGKFVKGEAASDSQALDLCLEAAVGLKANTIITGDLT